MQSPIKKHSIKINGHKTSFSLEAPFMDGLRAIAAKRRLTVQSLVEEIAAKRAGNLSSSIRVFVLSSAQSEAA